MKHMKTVVFPERKEEQLDFVSCDFCGNQMVQHYGYEVDKVTVSREEYKEFPEGFDGQTTFVDMCKICFTDKLIPWIRSQGVEPRTEENDNY